VAKRSPETFNIGPITLVVFVKTIVFGLFRPDSLLEREIKMFRFRKKGVTLIELLIVVLILAALSAIAIPRISQSATNAKKKACHTNLDVINSSIEMYNADTGGYPADLTTITQDTSYFPDGEPKCPVLDAVYPDTLVNNRVDASSHSH